MRIELILNEAKMRKTNERIREINAANPDSCILPELSCLNDYFRPYVELQAIVEKEYTVLAKDHRFAEDLYSVYVCGHNDHYAIESLTDYEEVRNYESPLFFDDYGVADNASQVLDYYDDLYRTHEEYMRDKDFVILMTPVFREDQPEDGGWRWHKWGPYIGVHEQRCQYLYDEKNIDYVYCFNIVEVRKCQND